MTGDDNRDGDIWGYLVLDEGKALCIAQFVGRMNENKQNGSLEVTE
jgi:hypothetical protein